VVCGGGFSDVVAQFASFTLFHHVPSVMVSVRLGIRRFAIEMAAMSDEPSRHGQIDDGDGRRKIRPGIRVDICFGEVTGEEWTIQTPFNKPTSCYNIVKLPLIASLAMDWSS
jgi:hypothetical protein